MATLVASDERWRRQQEAVVMRGSNNSRVTTMFAAATAADKRSGPWGTTGNGNNGYIRREAPSTAETRNDRSSGRRHNGGTAVPGATAGHKAVAAIGAEALGAAALGEAVLGAAALAIPSCGEQEGEGIWASFS